uniref:Piwi domain-containing protein n=1 Tax=Parascaris univalens TaxID=6257 RepID=A0A915BBS2_PARUN
MRIAADHIVRVSFITSLSIYDRRFKSCFICSVRFFVLSLVNVSSIDCLQPLFPDYKIIIREVGELRLSFGETDERSRTSMQFLDSLVTQRVRCPREAISSDFYPFKESIYLIPRPNASWTKWSIELGSGIETWTGLYSAVKVCQRGLMLNSDISTKAFYKVDMSLIDFYLSIVNEFRGGTGTRMNRRNLAMNASQREQLQKALQGLILKFAYTDTHMKFTSVGQPATVQRFIMKRTNEQPREMTVEDYFYNYKGIELEYGNLPTIQCGPSSKTIYIPMELLRLSDRVQRVKKRLSDFQLARLIKESALDPQKRFERIEFMLNGLDSSEKDAFLQAFETEIGNRFVRLDGRVLPSPHLELFNGFSIPVKDGVWPLRNRVTEAPIKVIFGVISVNGAIKMDEFRDPFNVLMRACELFGMEFARSYRNAAEEVFKGSWDTDDGDVSSLMPIINAFKKNVALTDVEDVRPMLIFVVPKEDSRIYAGIKVACDREAGIASQVISTKTFRRMAGRAENNAVAHNIFLKINVKLGGVNNRVLQRCLDWQKFTDYEEPTLFIGIDVTHPSSGDTTSPSIAAIVGSEDVAATRYSCSLKVQASNAERVVYMVDAMRERLLSFIRRTSLRPAHIIIFRDGVSNSEFVDTMNDELSSLKAAMNRLDSDYNPTLSYVVIQKRHRTRFFVERDEFARGKHNVPPGTVVDEEITSPNMFDFYLCSHLGAIGTSRPAHYTILYDSWNLSPDDWQQVAYALCHLYARCARSVSIPAPVYYAHLACQRARFYLKEALSRSNQQMAVSRELERMVEVHENAPRMYYI